MGKQVVKDISVVIPVYLADVILSELVKQLRDVLGSIASNYEIILVDDRSPDSSWLEIKRLCSLYKDLVGLRLSRNFGQHYAISAGLKIANGDWVVVMDCDMQDKPTEIPKLFFQAARGFDVVLARRLIRQDDWFKRTFSKLFYAFLSYLTGVKQDEAVSNFGIYSRKVIASINAMPESIRYFPTMVRWVGFNLSTVDVEHSKRYEGKSSYSFRKLMALALDICLVNSDKPLRLVVELGFLISICGFCFALYTLMLTLTGEIQVLGYASLIVSMWFLSGLIIFIMGVVGLYVGKSFEGIKKRPNFIIDEIISKDE